MGGSCAQRARGEPSAVARATSNQSRSSREGRPADCAGNTSMEGGRQQAAINLRERYLCLHVSLWRDVWCHWLDGFNIAHLGGFFDRDVRRS